MSNENENLSPAMQEEATDLIGIMHKYVLPQSQSLVTYISMKILTVALTGEVDEITSHIQSSIITGAHLYRRLLIESGVDVIALEKNFKPVTLD